VKAGVDGQDQTRLIRAEGQHQQLVLTPAGQRYIPSKVPTLKVVFILGYGNVYRGAPGRSIAQYFNLYFLVSEMKQFYSSECVAYTVKKILRDSWIIFDQSSRDWDGVHYSRPGRVW